MDIKQILSEFEAAKQQKAQAEKIKREAECTRRRLNAEKIQEHLNGVVLPLLESAKEQIVAGGYTCDVERVSKKDSAFPESETTFSLCLKLKTDRDSNTSHPHSILEFSGDFGSVTIAIRAKVQGEERKNIGPLPLPELTSHMVDQQIEGFLRAVFHA